jgi:hypothetical protein
MHLVAQQPPSLDTMLNDASYVFNRYQELAGSMNCSSAGFPERIKEQCRNLVKLTVANVEASKEALNRSLKSRRRTLSDLFEIYSELVEISSNLDGFSSQIVMFTQNDGMPYAQAASKATVLAANLGREIRLRLVLFDECAQQR